MFLPNAPRWCLPATSNEGKDKEGKSKEGPVTARHGERNHGKQSWQWGAVANSGEQTEAD